MKIAAIGLLGHIGYLFEGIRKNPELTLVGIAPGSEVDPADSGRKLAAEFGCPYHDDWRKLLDDTKPEVVGISTRFDLNGAISLECLARGIHCFTEKCVALDLDTLSRMKAVLSAGPARLVGMHAMRYTPEFFAAWQALQQGRIGTPRLFTGQKSYHFGDKRPDFYRSRKHFGGIIPWVGSHAVDWALWHMGTFEQVWAAHDAVDNFGFGECEAHAALAFRFQRGGEGTINVDFYRPNGSGSHGDDRMRLAGPEGVLEVRHGKALILSPGRGEVELPLEPAGDFFGDYCRELMGRGRCRVNQEETLEVTRLCLLARDAADGKRPADCSAINNP